jgi:YebC/PmpR family DNA-binding regulatory protein
MFEKRKHTMMARWDRMAKAFTRVGKEISIAVKAGGPNPDHNPALRRAIQNARSVNMPKDKVEAAIKRASGEGGEDYEELLYEGYAPHGVPIVVMTATDNPTRTVANLRLHFKKGNGNLGTSGSVVFQFDHRGVIKMDAAKIGMEPDELELDLIDHGLVEMEREETEDGELHLLAHCAFEDFGSLSSAIEEHGIEPISSEIEYIPQNTITLDEEQETEVLELVDKLEQDDDVQKVFHNLA